MDFIRRVVKNIRNAMASKIVKENISDPVPGYSNGIPWDAKDVTKAKPIGKIITKEMDYGGFQFEKIEMEVIDIIKREGLDDIYVINKWYKEYKKIPQLVPAFFVEEYIPYE